MLKKEYLVKKNELENNLKKAEMHELFCVIIMVITVLVGLMMSNLETCMAIVFAAFCSIDAATKTISIQTELRNLYRHYILEDEED